MQSILVIAMICLCAMVQSTSLIKPFEIEVSWVLQGRQFSFTGFFLELLGISSALKKHLPEVKVMQSSFTNHFNESAVSNSQILSLLFDEEQRSLLSLYNSKREEIIHSGRQEVLHVDNTGEINSNLAADIEYGNEGIHETFLNMGRSVVPGVHSPVACYEACKDAGICIGWALECDQECMSKGLEPHCKLKGSLVSSVTSQQLIALRSTGEYNTTIVASGSLLLRNTNSVARFPKPRVKIFHGTTCFYLNYTVLKPSVSEIRIGRFMVERGHFGGGMNVDELAVMKCAAKMDELWVPTDWNRNIFEKYLTSVGFVNPRVHVIPEAVDTELFDPSLGRRDRPLWSGNSLCGEAIEGSMTFEFLSIFKWERRKGWDLLLDSYWSAFTSDDPVLLRLHTYVPAWVQGERNITTLIAQYAMERYGKVLSELPAVKWEQENTDGMAMSRADVRNLYASADAFVLPTRGEGWGLPVVEAMAMNVPVIVSNCSGPAVFADNDSAYMIPVMDQLDDFGYSIPDSAALRDILQQVVRESCPSESGTLASARVKAARGREAVLKWSPDYVVGEMVKRLRVLSAERGYDPS